MVDPNRKINRLTDKDVEFLEECEREFALRYTEDDKEFMEHCSKPLDDPPIIENWTSNDFSWSDGGGRHHNRGGNRHQRSWRNNYKHRGGRESFGDRSRPYNRPAFQQQQNSNYKSTDMRKQYTNFVAASKDN